jgi:outer membrane immunogenic protein
MRKVRAAILSCVSSLAIMAAIGVKPGAAADIMGKSPPPIAPAPAPSWTGFYLGIDIGEIFGKNTITNITPGPAGPTTFSQKFQNTGFGLHGGYNYQAGNIVYGIEGDYDFFSTMGAVTDGTFAALAREVLSGLWSIRGRLGWASDNTLVYATGGVAEKIASIDVPGKATIPMSETNFDKVGAVVGGGIEYKVTPKISVGLEALYYLTSGSTTVVQPTPGPAKKFAAFSDNDIFDVRARLSYHF